VAVEVAGEQQNGGEVDGGGWWFQWKWASPERAFDIELERGIDEIVWCEMIGEVWEAEVT
jgi:hypothetical protein